MVFLEGEKFPVLPHCSTRCASRDQQLQVLTKTHRRCWFLLSCLFAWHHLKHIVLEKEILYKQTSVLLLPDPLFLVRTMENRVFEELAGDQWHLEMSDLLTE